MVKSHLVNIRNDFGKLVTLHLVYYM